MNERKDRLNLLVIEDETLVCMDLEEAVEELGHRVIDVAGHVDRALQRIATHGTSIDCVLLDANLGGHSARPIADILAERGIPYLVISGYDEPSVRRMGISGPVLAKPFNSKCIGSMLNAVARGETIAPPG